MSFPSLFRFVIVFISLMWSSLSAASPTIVRVESDATEVRLHSEAGVLILRPLLDSSIRVVFAREGIPLPTSSVCIHPFASPTFQVKESAQHISVITATLQVLVDRHTGRLTFLDAAGRELLKEPLSGARTLPAVQGESERAYALQQVFESPASEVLYGLGQFQDGLWNWRGVPLELRQLNTQIAVPMLISSKGYGLLWDNASLLDFNPVDSEIPLTIPGAQQEGARPNATEDLAKSSHASSRLIERTGSYTTQEAGDYVFFAKDGDRHGQFAIKVQGVQVAGVDNIWTPRALSAKLHLGAHTSLKVGLLGGGKEARLFARKMANTTTFRARMGDVIDYTFFHGPSMDSIIASYRKLTGEAPLWPKWALGLWQCRERYSSQQHILDTVAEFRRRRIPMDLIVQDWQYWGGHGWGAYEWDTSAYPDPKAMIRGIHEANARFMISVWCNPRGRAGEAMAKEGFLLGEWIDVFSEKVRALRWKFLDEAFFSAGTDAWWGDCTEPSDDGEGVAGQMTSAGPGSLLRNSYPLFASRSLYEGQLVADPDKRVCILTRSAYPGMQRYAAAAWSGDIKGDWETYRRQIPAGLNFSITGIPYWTTDTGGFFRPRDQHTNADYNELLARWFQWSSFCPILRVHGYQSETELWKYLPRTQEVLLSYDALRYRLLPYNYSVAWQVTNAAYTQLRPLVMDFPDDPRARLISDTYMFGPAFLVAPVTEPVSKSGAVRKTYLPRGCDWIDFWTGARSAGGQEILSAAPLEVMPLYVRSGSIVPLGKVLQYATEAPEAPYEIRVYPGADGSFKLFEDDGETNAYARGAYATIPMTWNDKSGTFMIGPRTGSFPKLVAERLYRIVRVGPGRGVGGAEAGKGSCTEVHYTGAPLTIPLAP